MHGESGKDYSWMESRWRYLVSKFLGEVPESWKFSKVPTGNLSHCFLLPEELSDDYLMILSWIPVPQWAAENA